MEKIFVELETVNSSDPESTADVAAHRCKLYRTLLEQRTATEHVWLAPAERHQPADAAHA
jgi:hypothetical protein